MIDSTETLRRALVERITSESTSRENLEARYGEVFDTEQLREAFDVIGFAAPLVIVRHKESGQRGTLFFQHDPRFFFSFEADES
jgi:hypothetical protein